MPAAFEMHSMPERAGALHAWTVAGMSLDTAHRPSTMGQTLRTFQCVTFQAGN